jgi:hypothetical protein
MSASWRATGVVLAARRSACITISQGDQVVALASVGGAGVEGEEAGPEW